MNQIIAQAVIRRAVESEVPSSDSDSWQFRLSDFGPTRPSDVLVT